MPAGQQARIALDGVSLRFRKYGEKRATLKQTVINAIFRRTYQTVGDFWLFKDLDLAVEHGQRLGIIGPNAAGKSTLLKLICGIFQPTAGRISVRGRLAPLIELGAGFNHELSGIENIYLNGALLGFGPSQMGAKIERILDFAGLSDFAQTPIKYYSTGMLLRLAFSVATDIEPEILLVDEIFAGGDAQFVAKATERMNKLMDSSHIVILVSHDLRLIQRMCNRVIWLDHGRIAMDGTARDVCRSYWKSTLPEGHPKRGA